MILNFDRGYGQSAEQMVQSLMESTQMAFDTLERKLGLPGGSHVDDDGNVITDKIEANNVITDKIEANNANFGNGLTVGGHDSPIGTRLTSGLDKIKVAAGIDTHHNGASLTLGKGTWIVIGRWNYNTRASGSTSSNRQVSIRVNGSNVNYQRINTYGVNYGMLQCFAVLELTDASTTVTCMGSCSLATNGTNYDSSNIWAVRIA